ncbi:MAG TPA: glycosyl hydrolase 115 family protein, partial [Pirellulales bacterium]
TPIYVDAQDWPGVARAASDLKADVNRVTKIEPKIISDRQSLGPTAIIIGTLGKSPLVDQLVHDQKIDVASIKGKWESYLLETVADPLPGVKSALVIAGSDKRGTIYGIYDLSRQIGVSPWYWWADVPVRHHDALFFKAGCYIQGPPAVKYRGIFLNDEAPALTGWVHENYKTYNHEFYAKVFELLLRLRANYLWPAMWDNSFGEDDAENPRLADEYGIVMGTSHVEPMMRADKEWTRHGFAGAAWNYAKNPDQLHDFWAEGIERTKNYESIVTLAMRGKVDTAMASNGSMQANIDLLEKVVDEQRKILAEKINPDVSKVPQLWALYKEVQGYYDHGMRVPDDVTLLWCDDNWGNVRRLPTPEERSRSGGAGMYYHFDYVGAPRNYKWINTNPLPKIWEQMNLCLDYGADRIWIVNVGDLKPLEFPISFFMQFAWDGKQMTDQAMSNYALEWSCAQFGPDHAAEIAEILSKYAKYLGRRKPELLEPGTLSLVNYDEADRVVAEFNELANQAEKLSDQLPADSRDAFFELVLHPTKAAAQVNELYVAAAKDHLYAEQGRAATNAMADRVRQLFKADQDLSDYFNHQLGGGKWPHMMDQTHIGYTNWQEPRHNNMPEVNEIKLPETADLALTVEGQTDKLWTPATTDPPILAFDVFNQPHRYVEIINRGSTPFEYSATTSDPWIILEASQNSSNHGKIDQQSRLDVALDWSKVPLGNRHGKIEITGPGGTITVAATAFNPTEPTRAGLHGFVETDGVVSIEAEHFTKKIDTSDAAWKLIPDYGRTDSGMTIFPTTAASVMPPTNSPCLEYEMFLFDAGEVEVQAIVGPTLNFVPGRGLRFAVSFDDQPPQIFDALAKNSQRDWEASVRDNARIVKSTHTIDHWGYHTLKIWMVDPAVVLEKLVVDCGGLKPSYLGPPESFRHQAVAASQEAMPQAAESKRAPSPK